MKRAARRIAGLFLAIAVLITVTCSPAAPVFAGGGDGPNILGQTYNVWAWEGKVVYPEIHLDSEVNNVNLYFWSHADNDWIWHQTCVPTSPSNRSWYGEVNPAYWADDYITLRFVVNFDGGYMHSEEFTINWTDYRGFERVFGSNRYETAFEISDMKRKLDGGLMSQYPAAVITCGTDFADALGGAYLASVYNAPILLVNNSQATIDDVVMELMNNLVEGGKIFILGGKGAVSGLMEERLAAAGFLNSQIERFDGSNRYDTNLKILEYCEVYKEDILICSGLDFPDALSASAVGLPILLVGKTFTEDQLERLAKMKPTGFDIIGGEGAVSAAAEAQLAGKFGLGIFRIAGSNRYETSQKVAERYFGSRQRFNVVVACGTDFPDGLAGGPLAYQLGGPLLLAENGRYSHASAAANNLGSRFAFILGGPTLISDETADGIVPEKP